MYVSTGPGLASPPITTSFQPGNPNERIGTAQQDPRTNQTQPRDAAAAGSQKSDEKNFALRGEDDKDQSMRAANDSTRGSLVDIQV